jgi:2-(3-amino-3-carboxypropyl)histidine synthase
MDVVASQESEDIFYGYQFALNDLIEWLRSNNIHTLAVQLPEGLTQAAPRLIAALESELDITTIVIADPCYGACDLIDNKVEVLSVDGIVQFGHAEIPNCRLENIPTKFIELRSNIDATRLNQDEKLIESIRAKLGQTSNIGLLANIQYIDILEPIKSILEANGYTVMIGRGDDRVKYPGQILGCNFSAARNIQGDVVGFVVVADGTFHPLGIGLATTKPVLAYDPISDQTLDVTTLKEELLRQRSGAIARAKECTEFGIILSTKPGQNRIKYAKKIRKKLEQNAFNGTLIAMENISPLVLDYLPYDAYINTACPRLAIDDYLQYKKVILTPIEFEILIGARPWGDYIFDEII